MHVMHYYALLCYVIHNVRVGQTGKKREPGQAQSRSFKLEFGYLIYLPYERQRLSGLMGKHLRF